MAPKPRPLTPTLPIVILITVHQTLRTLPCILLSLSVSACAGLKAPTPQPPAPQAAPESLQTRLEAYWRARVEHNMTLALQYEHPDQQKQVGEQISLARLRSGVTIKEFAVIDPQTLQPDPSVREAHVRLRLKYEYTLPFGGPMLTSTSVTDTWRKEGEVWYRVINPRRAPRKK